MTLNQVIGQSPDVCRPQGERLIAVRDHCLDDRCDPGGLRERPALA